MRFGDSFDGPLVIETTVVRDLNDSEAEFAALTRFLGRLTPKVAYLAAASVSPAPEPDTKAGSSP